MVHLLDVKSKVLEPTVLPVVSSETRTILHQATGRSATVLIMVRYIVTILITPVESWDNGPEPEEPLQTVGIMETCRRLTKQIGSVRRVVSWHSYIMPMRTMSTILSAVETMETCTRERDLAETERTIVPVF